ncbi:MAG: substrate-binding domain-containing protein [Alphaproteobacteria bacterium]|nr:substrate-binding domain-containing protein [Alphaproteobacteria bacterium]
MDISDLRTFETVARLGSMNRASSELNTVQSNVTARIRRLEYELATQLFTRHRNGVTLTEAGRRLVPYAHRAPRLLEEARRAVRETSSPSGTLTLGSLETTAAHRLSPILAQYGRRFPEVDLVLRTATNAQLLADVLEDRVEGAFVCGPVADRRLASETMFAEEEGFRLSSDQISQSELTVFRPPSQTLCWHPLSEGSPMSRSSKPLSVVSGLLGILALVQTFAQPARAIELKVLSSKALAEFLPEVARGYEVGTGNRVSITFGTSGEIVDMIERGELADIVVLPPSTLERLTGLGKLTADRVELATASVGLGWRADISRPEISTPDELRRVLLDASALAYPDPATGSASAVQFARVLRDLGIADEVRLKTQLVSSNAELGMLLLQGRVDFVVQMVSELNAIGAVEIIATLPRELHATTTYAAGYGLITSDLGPAHAFIQYLRSPTAVASLRAHGLHAASTP